MKSFFSLVDLIKLLIVRAFAAFDAHAIKKETERRQYERDKLEAAPDEFFADHFNGVPDETDRTAAESKANKTNT